MSEQVKLRQSRLSRVVEEGEFNESSLVGSWFHSDEGRRWQGCVVAEPSPGVYLVERMSWFDGESADQHLVRLDDMEGWAFYDSAEWMRVVYEYRGLAEQWEREREERQVQPAHTDAAPSTVERE